MKMLSLIPKATLNGEKKVTAMTNMNSVHMAKCRKVLIDPWERTESFLVLQQYPLMICPMTIAMK